MRIPLASTLKSRDGTLDQDAKVVNGIVEPDGDAAPQVRKRPGLLDLGLIRVGAAQLLYYWNGKVRTILGDYIGADYAGAYANVTTWNASDKGSYTTLSNGNLTSAHACASSQYSAVRSTASDTAGKWYYEVTIDSTGGLLPGGYIGFANATASMSTSIGGDNNSIVLSHHGALSNALVIKNNATLADTGVKISNGDVVGVFMDFDTGTLKFYKNNSLIYTGTNIPTGALYAVTGAREDGAATQTANFGASSFTYTPSGVSSTGLSPTSAGEQFSAQDNGANSPEALLMIKNSTQAWSVDTSDTVTQITDTDYPGKYTVTLSSLTRASTTATASTQIPTNFQVGATVTIAGVNEAGWNGNYTITGVTPETETPAVGPIEVTITRSSTTATATVKDGSAHGFVTGNSITISGADQAEYNGVKTVTVTGPTTFTFTVSLTTSQSPVTPATGSPVFSAAYSAQISLINFSVSGSIPSPLISSDYQNFRATALGGTHGLSNGNTALIFVNGASVTITAANVTASTFEFSVAGITAPYSGTATLQYPSMPTISSITRSGSTATVATSGAHGFRNGSSVSITGATQSQYNAVSKVITVTSTTTLTFELDGVVTNETPATPATGTITALRPGTSTGASFTFTVDGTETTPATGTITALSGRTTVPGIAYLNGYFCVMDEQGVIYNSAIDAPENWNALEFTSALNEPGAGVAIAKSGNYIAAFKEWSTEFFYDAKNPTESPLSPVENGFTLIGCAQGWSVANVDGSLMWIAKSKKHKGRQVYRMVGTEQAKVSTPDVERVLNADSLATVYAWGARIDGHPCYVLSLVASDLTLVYDTVSGAWYQWTSLTIAASKSITSITRSGTTATVTFGAVHGLSDGDPLTISGATQTDYNGTFQVKYVSTTIVTIEVDNSPATPATGTILGYPYTESYLKWSHYAVAGDVDVVLHVSDGHLYEIDPEGTQDDGVPINYFIRTARLDGGDTRLKAIGAVRVIGEKCSDTAMVRWSDDDSASFTKYRDVDLSAKQPEVRRGGSFRRRSYEFRHIGATQPRVSELEMDIGG